MNFLIRFSEATTVLPPQIMLQRGPQALYGHLSIRDFTLTSCQMGAYLHINSPIIVINKNQQLYRKAALDPLTR